MHKTAGLNGSRWENPASGPRVSRLPSPQHNLPKAGWYEGPTSDRPTRSDQPSSTGRVRRGNNESVRTKPPVQQLRSPRMQSHDAQGFNAFHAMLLEGQSNNFVIRSEAWPKIFSMISSKDHADLAMSLMLQDARIRDESNWDWVTHGYGQTIFQLVKAAAAVRAYHVCDWVLEHVATLRVTVNNDTIPNMMRKFGAAQADVEEIERLYSLEQALRGKNTNAGFYELSRAYRRNGDVNRLQALLKSAKSNGIEFKEHVLEDVETWLQKRR